MTTEKVKGLYEIIPANPTRPQGRSRSSSRHVTRYRRPPAASGYLRRKIGLVLPALVDASDRVCKHPRVRELYPEYLVTSHCIIRASVPLMETGRERALALADDDPVAAALAPYYEHHIPEELHHDDWLLDDLEVLGRERSDVLSRIPTPTVAALVGAQYYWMLHFHPVALLGYIAVLEGYPPTPELIDDLVASTGYDRSAFRTLRRARRARPRPQRRARRATRRAPPYQAAVRGRRPQRDDDGRAVRPRPRRGRRRLRGRRLDPWLAELRSKEEGRPVSRPSRLRVLPSLRPRRQFAHIGCCLVRARSSVPQVGDLQGKAPDNTKRGRRLAPLRVSSERRSRS